MKSAVSARGQVSVRTMSVARGMFALRYAATAVSYSAPRVIVSVDPDNAQVVKTLFSPNAVAGVLRQPGDLCVITAESDALVLITILGEGCDRPDAVTLELDRLDREVPALAAPTRRPALGVAPDVAAQNDEDDGGRAVPLRLAGHVERRGDLFVGGGEWLGDPNGTARIEGFSLQWPKRPANVDIAYGCALLGLGRMPDVIVGEYVGTRMKARAINGVTFSLIGADAEKYSLVVEARFSDGTHFGPTLAPVDLRGPTGREHLVALRLQLTEVKARKPAPEAPRVAVAAPQPAAQIHQRKPARIFRAPRIAAAM